MRRFVQVVLVVLALALSGGPAQAGTEQRPELEDECSGYVHGVGGDTKVRHASLDLCKGWFSASAAPSGAPALRVTLEVNTAPTEGLDNVYVAGWRSRGCRYSVIADGATGVTDPYSFTGDCDGPGEVTCTVPELQLNCGPEDNSVSVVLPAEAVTWDDDRLHVDLVFEGDLAQFAANHGPGSVLSDGMAWSAQGAVGAHVASAGCTSALNGRCWELASDTMSSVRTYTVGS